MKLDELRARMRNPFKPGGPRSRFQITMPEVPKDGVCEGCGGTPSMPGGLAWQDSRTTYPGCGECEYPADHPIHQYPGDERGGHRWVDPNKLTLLCQPCAKDHHEHWDDMWAEYYAGLL